MAIDQEFEALSRTLVALRKRGGMSQRKASVGVGIHYKSYSRIELRPECTTLATFFKLAKELGEPAWKILRHVEKMREHTG